MEDLVRVARDRDEAKARDSYTSTSEYWNNSNAEYPDVYTSRRVYIHRDIRTIARNKTFFAMLAAPSFFSLLEQPQRRQDALKKVEATARNSSPFVGYQTGAKPMSPVSFGAEIPRDPRLFLFFSFRFLFFFFLRANRFVARVQSLSIAEHELRGLDGEKGGKNAEKELVRPDLDEFIVPSRFSWVAGLKNRLRAERNSRIPRRLHFDVCFWAGRMKNLARAVEACEQFHWRTSIDGRGYRAIFLPLSLSLLWRMEINYYEVLRRGRKEGTVASRSESSRIKV